ncbi:MAG: hypothetical protein HY744_07875 [Deltaproteobacteria bacterium]|nr:hypothetical protein [Deltaproteobacteria bacterium]
MLRPAARRGKALRALVLLALAAACEGVAPPGADGVASAPGARATPPLVSAPGLAPAPASAPPAASAGPDWPARPGACATTGLRAPAAPTAGPPRARAAWIEQNFGEVAKLGSVLAALHEHHPEVSELVEIGCSLEGRPILALVIGRDVHGARARPSFLLDGAHHGDEPMSALVVLDAARHLLERGKGDPRVARWLDEALVWCLPLVNPDGFAAWRENFGSGRKNRRDVGALGPARWNKGVDLYRNYPFGWGLLGGRAGRTDPMHMWYRGAVPGSEPETQAMMRLAQGEHFAGAISYHVGTVVLLAPYTIAGVRSPEPNDAWVVAEHIVRRMPRHPDRPIELRRNLYPVDGTGQDWLRASHGTVALLVESALRSRVAGTQRELSIEAIRPSWQLLLDRYLDGPSVYGELRDASGRPVVAEVSIAEIRTFAGESWTSRCRDGRFDRYLPGPGSYTLRVRVPGGGVLERPFAAGAGRVRVDVTLPAAAPPGARCPAEVRPTGP